VFVKRAKRDVSLTFSTRISCAARAAVRPTRLHACRAHFGSHVLWHRQSLAAGTPERLVNFDNHWSLKLLGEPPREITPLRARQLFDGFLRFCLHSKCHRTGPAIKGNLPAGCNNRLSVVKTQCRPASNELRFAIVTSSASLLRRCPPRPLLWVVPPMAHNLLDPKPDQMIVRLRARQTSHRRLDGTSHHGQSRQSHAQLAQSGALRAFVAALMRGWNTQWETAPRNSSNRLARWRHSGEAWSTTYCLCTIS